MELHDVDIVGPQAPEAAFERIGQTGERVLFFAAALPARGTPLGGDEVRIAGRALQGVAQPLLRVSVTLGGVKKIHAEVQHPSNEPVAARSGRRRSARRTRSARPCRS